MTVLTWRVQDPRSDFMAKGHPPSPQNSVVAPKASSLPETKDSINLGMDARCRQLMDEVADILGATRAEFMVDSARHDAIGLFLEQRFFLLDAERYDAFVRMLDSPPAPGPRLRSLMRRIPAWGK